jgi:hypothetical protein
MKKGARICLVLPYEALRHKLWQQTHCYVLAVRGWKHKTARDTLCVYVCDLSVAVRYMYSCTVVGEVPNKKHTVWAFCHIHVIDILFRLKKTSVAVINVMGHHY